MSAGSTPPVGDRYGAGVLGHEVSTEVKRLRLLEQMLDPGTIRVLDARGIHTSWCCLELGAGAGSIARWLASRCPDGQVVATVVGTTFLERLTAPNLQVMQHNVVTEDFPPGSFDLVHARWLLVNLPEREEVLAKAVTWLAPGGWLVIETWMSSRSTPRRTPPCGGSAAPSRNYSPNRTVRTTAGRGGGCQRRWPRRVWSSSA